MMYDVLIWVLKNFGELIAYLLCAIFAVAALFIIFFPSTPVDILDPDFDDKYVNKNDPEDQKY